MTINSLTMSWSQRLWVRRIDYLNMIQLLQLLNRCHEKAIFTDSKIESASVLIKEQVADYLFDERVQQTNPKVFLTFPITLPSHYQLNCYTLILIGRDNWEEVKIKKFKIIERETETALFLFFRLDSIRFESCLSLQSALSHISNAIGMNSRQIQ